MHETLMNYSAVVDGVYYLYFSRATLLQDQATLLLQGDTLQPLALLVIPLPLEVLDFLLQLGDQATLPLLVFPPSVALDSLVHQHVCV